MVVGTKSRKWCGKGCTILPPLQWSIILVLIRKFWKEGIHLQASFSHHVTKWHWKPRVPIHHIPPDRELFWAYLIVLIQVDISLICPEKVNWEMKRVIWTLCSYVWWIVCWNLCDYCCEFFSSWDYYVPNHIKSEQSLVKCKMHFVDKRV